MDIGTGVSASLSALGTKTKDGFYRAGAFDKLDDSISVTGLQHNF